MADSFLEIMERSAGYLTEEEARHLAGLYKKQEEEEAHDTQEKDRLERLEGYARELLRHLYT